MNIRVIYILIFSLIITSGCMKQNTNQTNIRLLSYKGNVLVDGKSAMLNQVLPTTVSVKTSENSFCYIIFNDLNIIRIFPDTEIVINFNEKLKEINLNQGGVGQVLRKLQKSDGEVYRITTPTSVIAVRGTTFLVKCINKNETYVCDCNGRIDVSDKELDQKKTIQAVHHEAVVVTKENNIIKIKPAGMLFHNDSDIENLASLINQKIDWTRLEE